MLVILFLQFQVVCGISIKKSLFNVFLNWNHREGQGFLTHPYFGAIEDVPVFVVESQNSSPLTLKTRNEHIVAAFLDPRDVTDFLTEITQTGPPDEFARCDLRIRVITLDEWFEKADPNKERLIHKTKYKLIPSSSQSLLSNAYMPLRSSKDIAVPLFYSTRLVVPSTKGSLVTPLFFDFDDLTTYIKTIDAPQHREVIVRSVEVLSMLDLLLDNPRLDGYCIVPSLKSLKYCESEELFPTVKTGVTR